MKKVILTAMVALLGLSSCKKEVQCQCKLTNEVITIDGGTQDTISVNSNYGYEWVKVKETTRAQAKKGSCSSSSSTSTLHNDNNTYSNVSETKECTFN